MLCVHKRSFIVGNFDVVGGFTYSGGANSDMAYAVLSFAVQHVSQFNILESRHLPLDCYVVGRFTDAPIEVGYVCTTNPSLSLSSELTCGQQSHRYSYAHAGYICGQNWRNNVPTPKLCYMVYRVCADECIQKIAPNEMHLCAVRNTNDSTLTDVNLVCARARTLFSCDWW